MAISTGAVSPVTVNLNLNYSVAEATGSETQLTIQPKNGDGTTFDCTDVSTVQFDYDNGVQGPAASVQSFLVTGAALVASSTGMVCRIPGNIATTFMGYMKAVSGRLTVKITDGVNEQIVAYGSWSVTIRA